MAMPTLSIPLSMVLSAYFYIISRFQLGAILLHAYKQGTETVRAIKPFLRLAPI